MGQAPFGINDAKNTIERVLERHELLQIWRGGRKSREKKETLCDLELAPFAVSLSKRLPLRTASLLSSRTATNLDTPSGAIYTHSCVLPGRAVEIAEINCNAYSREKKS